ncbi:mRNA decay activator protein ZFP36L2 isoform X2 [Alligator mississippiensis]|uniref:mRNA decay activator protein ZFP36L2 isoform X2 n=1 Tax=Alligator mississippiensis TaxID=8496 RepID=UPI0003D0AE48|nr:mRNA decay activator protein ZFP36L2 isoform X2 [Alligator mississippiensis]
MSAALLSAFYDIDFLYKTEKSLSSMLDKKAVGTPVATPGSSFAPGFLRRHSTSNLPALAAPSSKFPGSSGSSSPSSSSSSSSFGSLKEAGSGGGSPTALLNKENKFRDRSFSETGERSQHLMQQLQQQQQGGKGGGGAPINSTRYKTELCRPFEESGACKYGEKCQFAHGFHELRSLTRHPKYKTELCRTFHTIGFCPYGPRCHFIHNADERRPAPQPAPPANAAQPPAQSGSGSTGDLRAAFAPRDPAASAASFPRGAERPKLHHSLSFSGFSAPHHHHHHQQQQPAGPPPAGNGLLEGSRTPPPAYCEELLPPACANNAFAFSGQELGSLIAPLALHTHNFAAAVAAAAYYRCQHQAAPPPPPPPGPAGSCPCPAPPASPPFSFQPLRRRLPDSPVFDAPPSPPDSLGSDRDSYLSGSLSSGSLSGSESPSLDSGRRLPIFSRLSISDD